MLALPGMIRLLVTPPDASQRPEKPELPGAPAVPGPALQYELGPVAIERDGVRCGRLKLHRVGAAGLGGLDQFERAPQRSAVVATDFSYDERRAVWADIAVGNFHFSLSDIKSRM